MNEYKKLDLIKEHFGILPRKNKRTYEKVPNKRTCWQFDLNFVKIFPIYLMKKQKTSGKSRGRKKVSNQ